MGEDKVGKDIVGMDKVGMDKVGKLKLGQIIIGQLILGSENLGRDNLGQDNFGQMIIGQAKTGEACSVKSELKVAFSIGTEVKSSVATDEIGKGVRSTFGTSAWESGFWTGRFTADD